MGSLILRSSNIRIMVRICHATLQFSKNNLKALSSPDVFNPFQAYLQFLFPPEKLRKSQFFEVVEGYASFIQCARKNFRKTNISPPDTHIYVCVSGGSMRIRRKEMLVFTENFGTY